MSRAHLGGVLTLLTASAMLIVTWAAQASAQTGGPPGATPEQRARWDELAGKPMQGGPLHPPPPFGMPPPFPPRN